ncbi:MAG: alpha/beta hydrolase [Spirochaetales bacterium]|nr:MAG: alpha/beta hydrolase [Spirochaetales bacterium]
MASSVSREFRFIKTNGVTLHVLRAGNPANPLAVLLHGFPEFHLGWDRQINDLVHAGFYVLAPDQRGYNLSDKPRSIGAYTVDKLALDIIGLIDSVGVSKAVIAGHDWGAIVAWHLGVCHPDRVEKLIIANVPHPVVFKKFYDHDNDQRRRSRYIRQFQVPILPEMMLRKDDFKNAVESLVKTSLPGSFSTDEIEEYKRAWGQPGALTGMLNWYRAMVRRRTRLETIRVTVPTLILWGKRDRFLKWQMAEASLEYCDDGRIEFFDDATHWVLRDRPEAVNRLIVKFLSR